MDKQILFLILVLSTYSFVKALPIDLQETSTQETPITSKLEFSPRQLDIAEGEIVEFTVSLTVPPTVPFTVNLTIENENVVATSTRELEFGPNVTSHRIKCEGLYEGHSAIFTSNVIQYDTKESWIYISVHHSNVISIIGEVIGWLYFTAWSISFWPQIIYVFRRKSVVGLSFDYVAMNLSGHLCYCFFILQHLFILEFRCTEYNDLYPRGIIQVQVNDVAFSIHAGIAAIVLVIECLIYERGDQSMSKLFIGMLSLIVVAAAILLVLSAVGVTTWLTYLYIYSYIKLVLTFVKYSPQVYFNFKRKSTKGWSIYTTLLDFVGGFASIIQMFLLAFNYDDWGSIFGDPSKFGLGVISVLFDTLFIIQHYCIYRNRTEPEEELKETTIKDKSQQLKEKDCSKA